MSGLCDPHRAAHPDHCHFVMGALGRPSGSLPVSVYTLFVVVVVAATPFLFHTAGAASGSYGCCIGLHTNGAIGSSYVHSFTALMSSASVFLQLRPPSAVSPLRCPPRPPTTALQSAHPRGVPSAQALSWFPRLATACQTPHL